MDCDEIHPHLLCKQNPHGTHDFQYKPEERDHVCVYCGLLFKEYDLEWSKRWAN